MKIYHTGISFTAQPKNYAVVDKYLSRSAQPQKEDFEWLKEQGVTDIFNFRTNLAHDATFDEKTEVEKLGMKYHNIPSITDAPTRDNINRFLREMKEVILRNGNAHMHCKAGADRTGMYAYIYKTVNNIGTRTQNQIEMIKMGHHILRYPTLLDWTNEFLNKFKK